MEDIVKFLFMWLGIASMIIVIYIDRRFQNWESIDQAVYWVIGWYIAFVAAWPAGVRKIIEKVISIDFSNFSIWFKKKDE